MANTSWRTWEVKNGAYGTEDSGAVTGWCLLAATNPEIKDTYHAGTQSGWIVLGTYCSEDDIYCFDYNSGDPWDEWAAFLQDEAVRLAEEKGLIPENTELLICRQEGFCGSQIMGYKTKEDDSPLKAGDGGLKND
tara:strand:- start:165 stop:569 length:405 start_codon:yes stop_codon:yes gene_type:complete